MRDDRPLSVRCLELLHHDMALHDDGGDDIAQCLGEATRAEDLADALLERLVDCEARSIGLAELIGRLRAAQQKAREREGAVRRALAMLAHSQGAAMRRPTATLVPTKTTPAVEVYDLEAIPAEYVRMRREADKAAIKADLAHGVVIEGVRLTEPVETVTIRRS